jgi:4-amino-4-deoxy-L-arabinose transferase-like glycosyltransferase
MVAAVYMVLAGAMIYVIDYYPKAALETLLMNGIPWSLRINFLLILIGIGLCRHDLAACLQNLFPENSSRRRIFLNMLPLLILLVLAFIMVSFVAPRVHRIYYDEDIYANIGQNIALLGQNAMANYAAFEYGDYQLLWSTYNKEPGGWPFLISMAFQLFGVNELYAFLLSNLLYLGGILVVFFITREIIGDKKTGGSAPIFPAFLAAAVYATIPHNLTWSNTAAAEPSAAFFTGLTVLCLMVWLRTGAARHLFLLAVVAPFACQFRPESGLLVALACAAVFIIPPTPLSLLRRKEFWAMGLPATLLIMPQLLHLFAVSGQDWGAPGAVFSGFYLWKNIAVNGPYYLNNEQFPVLFTLLAVAGLFFGRAGGRIRIILLVWFLLFWGIFLFFYAGSYRYGADVRFALLSFMPIAVLAGLGGGFVRDLIGKKEAGEGRRSAFGGRGILIIVVLIAFWMPFLPMIRTVGQQAWEARVDHQYAREFIREIPERSVVLTHIPSMFLLWNRNAIQTYAGVNNSDVIQSLMAKYQGHVYFHENYWCHAEPDNPPGLCGQIREKYELEEIVTATEQHRRYGLYLLRMKAPANLPAAVSGKRGSGSR